MSMQKTMILSVCLGILLVVMIPSVFAADGCGEGTVLVDGVCELAPVESSDGCGEGTVLVDGVCELAPVESSDGCGEGTVMVNGVCELAESSGTSIQPGYIAAGAAAIGAAVVGVIFAVRRSSSGTTTKPAKQDLEEYESKYLAKQGLRPSQKPAETRQTSSSCSNCGAKLKLTAKFCGKCGTPRS